MAKVAIEQTLGNIKEVLQTNNFEVVDLNLTQQTYIPDVSCYIISGQDMDIMGIADKQADIPVINAHGMSKEEVLKQVQQRVQMLADAKK
jgi:hypothetical protein